MFAWTCNSSTSSIVGVGVDVSGGGGLHTLT